MLAITHDQYGSPDVLTLQTIDEPKVRPGELLIEVRAFSVTTADWRMRASAFPAGLWLVGRLITGLLRPRHPLSSREFSGRVLAVGANARRFEVGDDVVGIHDAGVSAERIAVPESAVLVRKPDALTYADAAALPFGGLTAVEFLRDYAKVQPGERVLIVGASGGVGVYLVQFAKHLGAHVTAVASAQNLDFVRALGADDAIDYTIDDPRAGAPYDVIVDTIGKTTFAHYRHALTPPGRHVFIEGGLREMVQAAITPWRGGPRVLFGVARESTDALEALLQLVDDQALRPVVGHRFPLQQTKDAHWLVERRHRKGAVIVDVGPTTLPSE